MLQSHKSKTTTDQRQKQQLRSRDTSKQQHAAKQQEENLEDYTMEEIMQDLVILEQQQREAQRKLASAQTMKQKRLDQQRQLNTLLEQKNYSNGALRAKLLQARNFLSIATRDLGNRKLLTDRLQHGIADFERKLKRGLKSARMVRICHAKIESFFIIAEHNVAKIVQRKGKALKAKKELRKEFDRLEERDRMTRLAIQDSYQNARAWSHRKRNLRITIEKLDLDKVIAQNTEQSIGLRIRNTREQIKAETDHAASTKVKISRDIEHVMTQIATTTSEIQAKCASLQSLIVTEEAQTEKILECFRAEGKCLNLERKNISEILSQAIFREHILKVEEEAIRDEDRVNKMNAFVEEKERAIEESKERTIENHKETSTLITSAKSMTKQEETRQQEIVEFQSLLESARTDVVKLNDSFREMKETRMAESRVHSKSASDRDVEIEKQTKAAEDLRLKMKQEDTSYKTKIRLFEDIEKPQLQAKLEQAKNESQSTEKKYLRIVEISNENIMEPKIQAELKEKFTDEMMALHAQKQKLSSACIKYTKSFPELRKIDFAFNEEEDRCEQLKLALVGLENNCEARKSAAEAMKEQKAKRQREYRAQVEATKFKRRRKDELHATRKRHQLREVNFDNAAEETICHQEPIKDAASNHVDTIATRRRQRRRKGSDFFDPEEHGNNKLDAAVTPNEPRQLISSFLSQSSGHRVRWKHDDDDNTCDDVEVTQDCSINTDVPDSFVGTSEMKTESDNTAVVHDASAKTPRVSNTANKKPIRPKHHNDRVQREEEPQDDNGKRSGRTSKRRLARSMCNDGITRDTSVPDSITKKTRFPFDDVSHLHSNNDNNGAGEELHKEHRKRMTGRDIEGRSSGNDLSNNSRKRSRNSRGVADADRDLFTTKRIKSDQNVQQIISSDKITETNLQGRGKKRAPCSYVNGNREEDLTKDREKPPRKTGTSILMDTSTFSKDADAASKMGKSGKRLSKTTSRTSSTIKRSTGKQRSEQQRELHDNNVHQSVSVSDSIDRKQKIKSADAIGGSDSIDCERLELRDRSSTEGVSKISTKNNCETSINSTRKSLSMRGINKGSREKPRVSSISSGRGIRKTPRQKNTEEPLALGQSACKERSEKHRKDARSTEPPGGTKIREKISAKSTSSARNACKDPHKASRENPNASTRDMITETRKKPSSRTKLSSRSASRESRDKGTVKATERRRQSTLGVRKESSKNPSSLIGGKASRAKSNETSGRTSTTRKESRGDEDRKSDTMIRKKSLRKGSEVSREKTRVKLNTSVLSKEASEQDRKTSMKAPPKNKSGRGESTRTEESTKVRFSSSSKETRELNKRKTKGDDASTSASNKTIIARRRKKRSGQRSKVSSTGEVSCDIDFQ